MTTATVNGQPTGPADPATPAGESGLAQSGVAQSGIAHNGVTQNGLAHNGSDRTLSDVGGMLAVLRREVLALSAQSPWPMSRIRVAVGDVAVEVGWADEVARPAAGAARGSTATAPAPSAVRPATGLLDAGLPDSGPLDGGTAGNSDELAFVVTAHTVGVFYHAPEPGAAPFVRAGDTVVAGQQIGIIEAMKLMIPVEVERAGRVRSVLVPDAAPVEFGQPLLTLEVSTSAGSPS